MGYFENTYYNTYYYANIVSNVLTEDIELIGFISNFFADESAIYYLAKPFEKRSAFHCFIESIVGDFFSNDVNEHDQRIYNYHKVNSYAIEPLYAESVLRNYGMLDYTFNDFLDDKEEFEYNDIEEYNNVLTESGTFQDLFEKIAEEIFYIMFNNRVALLQFNSIVASHMDVDINDIEEEDVRKLFNANGRLKRVRVPEWCKNAVFFRDRGKCTLCNKDLSGTISLEQKRHYDHIIPLAQGGLNDVSNIQLLCSVCNSQKSHKHIITSSYYEKWY